VGGGAISDFRNVKKLDLAKKHVNTLPLNLAQKALHTLDLVQKTLHIPYKVKVL